MNESSQKRTTGYMLKKGGGKSRVGESLVQSQLHRRNWCRRFFVLDVEAGELKYYKDATLLQYKGTVRILATSSVHIPDAVHLRGRHRPGKRESVNYFELRDVHDDEGRLRHRPFALRAPSAKELIQWLRTLEVCLSLIRRDAGVPVNDVPPALATTTTDRRTTGYWDEESSESEGDEEDVSSPPALAVLSSSASGSQRVAALEEVLVEDLLGLGDDVEEKREDPPPSPLSVRKAALAAAATLASSADIFQEERESPSEAVPRGTEDGLSETTPPPGRRLRRHSENPDSSSSSSRNGGSYLQQLLTMSPRRARKPPPLPSRRPAPPPPPPADKLWTPPAAALAKTSDLEATALRELALASASRDGDALAVCIAHAVHECGVDASHPAVRRAQNQLALIDRPGDLEARRAAVEAALDDAHDAAALGAAIRDALDFGLDDHSHHVLKAQARLVGLLVGVDHPPPQREAGPPPPRPTTTPSPTTELATTPPPPLIDLESSS
mmetsp:Transcript_20092/g.62145  ORF Transcript_20092/g.62145 Transcript_20092/m.62145 type:complete len:498 (+) Transcript_20092:59-1552(+)